MTKIEIEKRISELKERVEEIASNKRMSEAKLAKLSATVRMRKGKLPSHEYKSICREQAMARDVIIKCENEIKPFKQEIRKLSVLAEEIKEANKTAVPDVNSVVTLIVIEGGNVQAVYGGPVMIVDRDVEDDELGVGVTIEEPITDSAHGFIYDVFHDEPELAHRVKMSLELYKQEHQNG